jgi:DNA-binding transcriptional regulator YdaS (Cro superfamily)
VFCTACGTTEGYLRSAISRRIRLGETLCIQIERHSAGAVSIAELRPDLAEALSRAHYVRDTAGVARQADREKARAEAAAQRALLSAA